MFDELVRQARRLFSSKSNAGKQVSQLTDRLHTQKQVLLALSIVLLLGYAQFRDHFQCQGIPGVDHKTVTNFCLINGTTTVVHKHKPSTSHDGELASAADDPNADYSQHEERVPHVGHHFVTNAHQFRVINHNYMRSMWALLILLAMCSFFAQRNWAKLFQQDDVLQALLQLSGSQESPLVRAAEQARPYEMLSALSSNLSHELEMRTTKDPQFERLPRNERVARKIDLVDSYNNIYDHQLDYYPNQLAYMLLTKNTAAYKLSCLKLRRKLILNTIYSTFFTLMQFLLPLLFIGNEYIWYGWDYMRAALRYLSKLARPMAAATAGGQESDSPVPDTNSIDYELSSSIFPTSTQCEFKQFGMAGSTEATTVQCTVAINEICSKLFVVIWWFVALNLLVELYGFISISVCSINFKTLSWTFGWRFWPNARAEADLIARFRFSRAALMHSARLVRRLHGDGAVAGMCHNDKRELSPLPPPPTLAGHLSAKSTTGFPCATLENATSLDRAEASPAERKRLEAEAIRAQGVCRRTRSPCNSSNSTNSAIKREYNKTGRLLECRWCPRRLCAKLVERGCRLACCRMQRRQTRLDQELTKDLNIYYLLYLIYLRTGKSKSRIETIIKMTACALNNYLADLEECLAVEPAPVAEQHLPAEQPDETQSFNKSLIDEQLKFMS